MTDNRTTELLRKLLDERSIKWVSGCQTPDAFTGWHTQDGYGAAALEKNEVLMLTITGITPEQAIAATLGDGDYELKMDELLCRLTNGKWSKTRSYSVDFMVSCVDEAYEDATLEGVNPDDLPNGLTLSDDGNLLNWRGENYVRQSTLGGGKLTAEQVWKAIYEHSIYATFDGVKYYAEGIATQLIADELNATLGGETCEFARQLAKLRGEGEAE